MDKVIEPSAQIYDLCGVRVGKLLEGLDDVAVQRRVHDGLNPIIWIVGHVVVTRCNLARALGSPVEHAWGDRFNRGAEVDDPRPFPPTEDVLAKMAEVGSVLERRFEELTEEELSAPAPRDFPIEDKTMRGMINFLGFHEAYHLGQLGFLRQWVLKT